MSSVASQLASAGYLSAQDIAATQGYTLGYVRKKACVEGWERVKVDGRTYYRMPSLGE